MSFFVTGAAGTGKTTELQRRAREGGEHALVLTNDALPHLALDVLAHSALGEMKPEIIDDIQAAMLFEEASQPLLTLEWTEFLEAQLDPEVPGLRAPQRFLDAAFRLFGKFREALITPEQFLESALRGAASFYARPPNLAHPDLLYSTKETHQSSLDVDAAELQRQYRREVDLAKILAKLYRSYLDHPVRQGCLTARDAIAEAVAALRASPELAAGFRMRFPVAFVDDAQELTLGAISLLQAIYGDELEGVTLAGDENSATSTFRGARPDRVFSLGGERLQLTEQRRSPYAIDAACNHILGTTGTPPVSTDPEIALTLFRASNRRAEIQFIADHVVALLQRGARADQIALLFRSVATARPYCDALLARDINVQIAGDLNVFAEPEALDALAILMFAHDPFRHEWLLRVLSSDAVALTDATLSLLCSEPPDAQTELFTSTAGKPPQSGPHAPRWDPKRDVRLGWNVIRGDRDNDVTPVARERLTRLRTMRAGWRNAMRSLPLPEAVRRIWSEGLAHMAKSGSAKAAYQQLTLRRLYDRIERFARERPDASLPEFLAYAEERIGSPFESCEDPDDKATVRILSIDAARGKGFDHVVLPNARAGAFPRYYVPDAFLYSPSLGMIAKENVGEARAARTAKFTYYMFKSRTRERYNREERRAFAYALRRAARTALVTASEKATRGVAAPEFLSELQAARLPGTIDLSERWKPSERARLG